MLKTQRGSRDYDVMVYLAELSLQASIPGSFSHSQIAASICVLARYMNRSNDIWPDHLQHATEFAISDLAECSTVLCRRIAQVRHAHPDLTMIDRKHRALEHLLHRIPSFDVIVAFHEQSQHA